MRALNTARTLLPSRKDYAELPRSCKGDLVAGDTVGIVALASASAPERVRPGLITAVIARVVAAVFGGSTVQV